MVKEEDKMLSIHNLNNCKFQIMIHKAIYLKGLRKSKI
jgi:hypothetical protein